MFKQVEALPALTAGQSHADVALSSDLEAVALLNLGVTEAWSLRLTDSERHLVQGAALARDIGRPYLEVACLAHLGFAATIHSFELARRRCEEAIAVAAGHGWDTEPVIAPALATMANALIWRGQLGPGEQWLDRARRATRSVGEPGVRLLVALTSAMLQAARGQPPAGAGRVRHGPAAAGTDAGAARADLPHHRVDDRGPGPARGRPGRRGTRWRLSMTSWPAPARSAMRPR